MTFVRTPATPRKPFGSGLSSLRPPFPPFGLPANQGSFHFYLGSSTFWEPAQQGASGDFAEDVKATPLRIWGGSVVDGQMTATPPGGQHIGVSGSAPAPIAPHRSCGAGNPRDARSYSTCYRSILKPTLMVTWNSCTAPSTMRPRFSTTSNQSMWRIVFEPAVIPALTASAKLVGEVPTNSTILWVPAILFPLSMEVSV